jgi:hypothetical protein
MPLEPGAQPGPYEVVAPLGAEMSSDGLGYVYSYQRVLGDLYLAEGLQ